MKTKDIIYKLRTEAGLSQDELAERVYVSRQAVSRWENGDTVPNTETLKLLSKLFDVSINTLLGEPNPMLCKCCGMPIEPASVSKEANGTPNEEYCKWCYTEGTFTLDYWKIYAKLGGEGYFEQFKQQLMDEFNALEIEGMPPVENLNVLPGSFVNLEYPLPNGSTVKLLDDNATYLGNQLEPIFGGDRCLGIVANMSFLLVCTYEADGKNPELVLYKKR